MELRHLEAALAVATSGSFTAAADALGTVQSNVSDQVRQLEAELGVPVLIRARGGARPTEFGAVVIERARRIRRELDDMRADLSMIRGLEAGEASLGVVGTSSRWMVPELASRMARRAPGVKLRIVEAASERLSAAVLNHDLAQAVVTEPVTDSRFVVSKLRQEDMVALLPPRAKLQGARFRDVARLPLILPPVGNPLRAEIDAAAIRANVSLQVHMEVEGIRLISDLVFADLGATILPATAVESDHRSARVVKIADMPPRRLSLIAARDISLSLADEAVHEILNDLVQV